MRLGHDPSYIVRHALSQLWDHHQSFDVGDADVLSIANEFEAFLDSTSIRYRFWSQLLNFRMEVDKLQLTEELTIRRLTEDEISSIYGGPLDTLTFRPPFTRMQEFIIEGETTEQKLIGDQALQPVESDNVRDVLDRAMLCLRTFKEGRVGYDSIHLQALGFCPFPGGSIGYGDLYVPLGSYNLLQDEISALKKHAALIFPLSELSMELACSRLADAETRVRVQDQIVDAVIGLEALLLAGLAKEDRKSELKFRFALHYSTLFDSPKDRHRAYKVAKDLYDLRSQIVHGSGLSKQLRIGDEKVPPAEAGKRARDTLRTVIERFLPLAKEAPYKRHTFWEAACFGLPESPSS